MLFCESVKFYLLGTTEAQYSAFYEQDIPRSVDADELYTLLPKIWAVKAGKIFLRDFSQNWPEFTSRDQWKKARSFANYAYLQSVYNLLQDRNFPSDLAEVWMKEYNTSTNNPDLKIFEEDTMISIQDLPPRTELAKCLEGLAPMESVVENYSTQT